jgi:hypothetical protein
MSQTISIANKPEGNGGQPKSRSHKPEGNGAASVSRSHKPEISDNVLWRRDGQDDQIIVASREGLPLPLILNPTASWIFSLCNGRNTLEGIAQILCDKSDAQDFSAVLGDVKRQVEFFLDKGIVEI